MLRKPSFRRAFPSQIFKRLVAATQKIRATEGFNGVPVIAVTAHQETDFREGAKAAGFAAYVTKPIDMNWLSELIKGLLV